MANEEKTRRMIPCSCTMMSLLLAGRTLEIAASWSQIGKPIKRTI